MFFFAYREIDLENLEKLWKIIIEESGNPV